MASLYKESESPFWYLKYKSSDGRWRCKSLRPLRHGISADTRKAYKTRDEHSLEEHSRSPQRDAWASWVPDYLKQRYTKANETLRRVQNGWQRISDYLIANKILAPQDLTYRHCMDYMPVRTKSAAHNTARFELKVLALVCDEAVRRGIIDKNPASKLGIGRVRGREKPELTDDHIAAIRQALKSEPDWMSHAFEIAIHQGCRLSETALFASDVDLMSGRLHFRRTKGDKPFSVPIHPAIKDMLQNLLVSAAERSPSPSDKPVEPRIFHLPEQAARDFHRFFKKLGLGATFHSTRVTVASRLARSGYSITKAMRLLNHSSELVHRSYQRLQAEDVADAYEVLRIPAHEADNQSSEIRGDRAAIGERQ